MRSRILISIILFFIINACTEHIEEKSNAPVNFKTILGFEPISYIDTISENKELIFCLVNKAPLHSNKKNFYSGPEIVYYQLKRHENDWKIETQKIILKEEFSYLQFFDEIEMVNINSKNYLYFVYLLSPMGNATDYEELNFALFSISDNDLTSLPYGGFGVYDDKSNFVYMKGNESLAETKNIPPDLLVFLKEKQKASPLIYKPTAKDSDLTDISNYEKKWAIDNPDMPKNYNSGDTLEHPMKITYYDQDLFKMESGQIYQKEENNRYTAIALFRNNILCYDKKRKRYFPVWVESCAHGCNKSINFLNDSILEIISEEIKESSTIKVNLFTMTYRYH